MSSRHSQSSSSRINYHGTYKIVAYLGKGSYGSVYEAIPGDNNTKIDVGTTCAIKHITEPFASRTMAKRILRELRLLRCLNDHPNIVKMLDLVTHKQDKKSESFESLSIVLECMECDLKDILQSEQYFSKGHVQYILYQMLCAVDHMHQMYIAHRDLKPANILINANCDIRICDFGLSRNYDPEDDRNFQSGESEKGSQTYKKLTNHVVTRWYRAPEIILLSQTRRFLHKVDVWALGCIFAELLTMLSSNQPNSKNRAPLFPGSVCYPLSPAKNKSKKNRNKDQLSLIFNIIGRPSVKERSLIHREDALSYLKTFPYTKSINWFNRYPGCVAEEIALLVSMIQFHPANRISCHEAIRHPFVKRFRSRKRETRPEPVKHEFEDKDGLQVEDYCSLMEKEIDVILFEQEQARKNILRQRENRPVSNMVDE